VIEHGEHEVMSNMSTGGLPPCPVTLSLLRLTNSGVRPPASLAACSPLDVRSIVSPTSPHHPTPAAAARANGVGG